MSACLRFAYVVCVGISAAGSAIAVHQINSPRSDQSLTHQPSAADLGYQVHSWNDIREWPQLLRKTVLAKNRDAVAQRLFVKIDPHYMPTKFCDSQTRPIPRGKVKRGCLVLNHDTPITAVTNYSTVDDVLFVLEAHLNSSSQADSADLTTTSTTISMNVSLALCFKSAPFGVCDGLLTEAARDWLGLVDDLLARVTAVQERHPGSGLEIVLDGDGTPGGSTELARARTCLYDRCVRAGVCFVLRMCVRTVVDWRRRSVTIHVECTLLQSQIANPRACNAQVGEVSEHVHSWP